jgi:glyoxylase-like metal-dependent hydrolase (beta-lactamase superfamily II)
VKLELNAILAAFDGARALLDASLKQSQEFSGRAGLVASAMRSLWPSCPIYACLCKENSHWHSIAIDEGGSPRPEWAGALEKELSDRMEIGRKQRPANFHPQSFSPFSSAGLVMEEMTISADLQGFLAVGLPDGSTPSLVAATRTFLAICAQQLTLRLFQETDERARQRLQEEIRDLAGLAAVVDPQRDVDIYVEAAQKQGLAIRAIFETHLHADFVSGHRELAARTGAQIYLSRAAGATFPHVAVDDGYKLHVGKLDLEVLATPGHTPESISLLVTDEEKGEQPWAVLTGDTLFIGDVGRPDLSSTHTPGQLAGMMYDSLHDKLMTLPDSVMVYPAHGAGSLCGRNMRAERFSTIGTERLTNYALQIKGRDEFVQQMTSNLPARPDYFLEDAAINRAGAPALAELPALKAIAPAELLAMLDKGATALDVRPGGDFIAGHVPGSVSIPLSGQFASWAGAVLGLSSRPVLIAATAEQLSEARVRLARAMSRVCRAAHGTEFAMCLTGTARTPYGALPRPQEPAPNRVTAGAAGGKFTGAKL